MAAALFQGIGTFNSGGVDDSSIVLTVTKTVTVGNTIFVTAAWGNPTTTTPSCTDNLGNTYGVVEKTHGTSATSVLLSAPVTTGGSLTTITVSMGGQFATTRTMIAAEFSGVGALSVLGGGTFATSGTATWINNKGIPANGLAIGLTSPFGHTQTIGGASGSPSTTPVIQASWGTPAVSLALCYAIAGGSDVTGFTGTTTFTSDDWVSNGATYAPLVTGPVWVSPADTVPMNITPVLQFTSPSSASAQHFNLQLDTANTFNTGSLRDISTYISQTGWEYWDGSVWVAFPGSGMPANKSGNDVRHIVQTELTQTTWYRRVRAGV